MSRKSIVKTVVLNLLFLGIISFTGCEGIKKPESKPIVSPQKTIKEKPIMKKAVEKKPKVNLFAEEPGKEIVDFSKSFAKEKVKGHGGKLSYAPGYLEFSLPPNKAGSIQIFPPNEKWDFSQYTRLIFDLENQSGDEMQLKLKADNKNASWTNTAYVISFLEPSERACKNVYLVQERKAIEKFPEMKAFQKMNGLPGGFFSHWVRINASDVRKINVSIDAKPQKQVLRLYGVKLVKPVVPPLLKKEGKGKYMPFIDTYGQDIHGDWPGKIKSDEDLKKGFAEEEKDLAANPKPADLNKWGGWAKGPKLKATGFFRTEKHNGKWWLVDPDGHLFWSHGFNCVGDGGAATMTSGREEYFILPKGPEFENFLTVSTNKRWKGKKFFDFTGANLLRGLGKDWQEKYKYLTQRRLASWGVNTMGGWSNKDFCFMRKTPYTITIHPWSPGVNDNLRDPFNPGFRKNYFRTIEKAVQDSAGDPWCIGYFVDNELHWEQQPMKVMKKVAFGPAWMKAKVKFVNMLKKKYGDIGAFNKQVDRDFESWDAVLANKKIYSLAKIKTTCDEFYIEMSRRYFKGVRDAVKKFAPNQLYLGCRMNHWNSLCLPAAAEFCDVVSLNIYKHQIGKPMAELKLDKPFMVSEYHFGTQDRGMWGLGLCWSSDQKDRARMYEEYVGEGLANPNCVGTHWFQYNSQAFTGRGDGENYQVGTTDIGGRPWPEFRDAIRNVGKTMYKKRSAK